jgi:DNA-damage-inducible protein J
MGLSVSDAVRMMLVRVAAEKALPFDVRAPNATTVKAMQAADKGQANSFATVAMGSRSRFATWGSSMKPYFL